MRGEDDAIHRVTPLVPHRAGFVRSTNMVANMTTVGPAGLDEIDELVIKLFAMVTGGLAAATDAFLDGDREAARTLVADDRTIDSMQSSIEALVERELGRSERGDADLRRLVSVLRIVPELERSGDRVAHIA